MKKHFNWIAIVLLIACIFCGTGCNQEVIDTTAPSEVLNFSVTASNGKAILTWENPPDQDFAGVRISNNPTVGGLSADIMLGSIESSFTINNMQNGRKYEFKIQTFDRNLNFSEGIRKSAIVEDTSDYTPPKDVTNLVITASNGNAVLTWENPVDEDFAGIQISMEPGEDVLVNPIILGKDITSFTISGLEISDAYTFEVKTFDSNLNFSFGNRDSVIMQNTIDTTPPKDVTNLVITASNGNAVLTWENPTDIDFAGVQVAMSPAEGTLANAVILGKDVTSLNVSGLKIESEYTFTVKTFDTSLNYSVGKEVTESVEDTADYVAPADVTNLKVVAADGNAVLTWTNPADTDFAGVQITMNPAEGSLANAVMVGKEVTSFTLSGLENNKEYTFTVKTFDASLNYSTGATEKATVADNSEKPDITAPADVTNLKVVAADGNAVLTWTNPGDDDFAGVQVAMSPAEGTLANAVILGKDVTSLNVSGLEIGSEYTFTVKTFDTSLNYSTGAESKATVADNSEKPDTTAPANVTNLVATNKDASVLLTWEDATDEDVYGYEVTWNKSNPINRSAKMTANSMMIAPGAEGCYISNLTNGTEYTFTVKTVDTSGNKSEGVSKTITPSIIEKSPLEITLTPSTTEKTNQDVVISVNVTTDNASEVKKITYKEGIFADIDDVLSGTDISTTKEITATENTTYTVAAVDTAGRRELKIIEVNNIDREAPAKIENVVVKYYGGNNKFDLSWTNPSDKDFVGIEIKYGKIGSEELTTLTCKKNVTSIVIKDIEDDNSQYVFYFVTKDDIGNSSEPYSVTEIAEEAGLKITELSIDKNEIDMENRDIVLTIKGRDFIYLQRIRIILRFENSMTYDEKEYELSIEELENNSVLYTYTVPQFPNTSDVGKIYTLEVYLGNEHDPRLTEEITVIETN